MFHSYYSSSDGNLYTVDDGRSGLLLECGVPYKTMQKALNFGIVGHYAACLISHEHMDHARAADDLIMRGVPVWCSEGTARERGIQYGYKRAKAGEIFKVGTFSIMPFTVKHDAAEPLGYLILSSHLGTKLMFATDTEFIPPRFGLLTEIAVECNYVPELMAASDLPAEAKRRIMLNHMGLDTVIDFIRANDMSAVTAIHLLHMSNERGHAERAKTAIQAETGKAVYIC